ncbi:phosphopantetheine-binding protein [Alphaproteobacteria bacterium]|nr:phosphopantetheine-binding protein [Alphaproteobacteria bacterium]
MNNMDKLYVDLSEILEASLEELRNNLRMEESEVWDSLKHMELIAMIESNYNVNLTVDEIIKMTSIKEITNVLSERI